MTIEYTDPGFSVSWTEFKEQAKEFFDRVPTATEDEAGNGFKALTLQYFGLTGSELEMAQARSLLQLAARKVDERLGHSDWGT